MKNVAGYDLAKLFCGSRGRLGAVERLALRLHPLPAAARTAVVGADWPALHHSQLVPSAVDIADGRMHVLFEGSPRAVDAQLQRARRRGGASRGTSCARCRRELPGRVRWDGEDAPLVRPGPRVAYVEQVREPERGARSPSASLEAMCSPS